MLKESDLTKRKGGKGVSKQSSALFGEKKKGKRARGRGKGLVTENGVLIGGGGGETFPMLRKEKGGEEEKKRKIGNSECGTILSPLGQQKGEEGFPQERGGGRVPFRGNKNRPLDNTCY